MRALADFGTPMLIGEGYRTFPVTIFNEFISEMGGDDGFAAAISIVAIVITTVVFLIQQFYSLRKSFTMNATKQIHPEETNGIKRFSHPCICLLSSRSFDNAPGVYLLHIV